MKLQGERLIPAKLHQTWAALNDPAVLKTCITGCELLERTDSNGYAAVVAVKVGPVSAHFKGNLQMTKVEAPNSYTISFQGQGGVAGFAKGSADVWLLAAGGATQLTYAARAQVGGKIAQIGSRLIDSAASKIAEDFFKAFEAHLRGGDTGRAVAAEPIPPRPAHSLRIVWWALVTFAAIAVVLWLTR